ncbi:hypothetical protein [Negadavirga shengliensis]|uniref:Uncharacterized protein n=1 Tax=Negadavirga shengliensis TaxID=1389218 RepID=A0ABV9T0B7_9BACT
MRLFDILLEPFTVTIPPPAPADFYLQTSVSMVNVPFTVFQYPVAAFEVALFVKFIEVDHSAVYRSAGRRRRLIFSQQLINRLIPDLPVKSNKATSKAFKAGSRVPFRRSIN